MRWEHAVCQNYIDHLAGTIVKYGSPSFASLTIYCPQDILCPKPKFKKASGGKILVLANHVGGTTQVRIEIMVGEVTDYSNQVARPNHYFTRHHLDPPFEIAYSISNLSVGVHLAGAVVAGLLIKLNFYQTGLIVIPAGEAGIMNEILSSPAPMAVSGAAC